MPEMYDDGILNDVRMESISPETLVKARITVCRMADSATEAKQLLQMLGLMA